MFPRLIIDLERIRANAERMVAACSARSVDVMGITKGVAGDAEVARALVAGGVTSLGDARLENLRSLREAQLGVPLWLIRAPSPSEASQCVELADGSLQSDIEALHCVASEASRRSREHHVLLMVDLDTGREGIDADELSQMCVDVAKLEGILLDGIGTYFDFRSTPSAETLRALAGLAAPNTIVSGGASNVLELLVGGTLPEGINHLRLGTAPLLGLYTSHGPRPIDGWERDTMIAEAEVIEVKRRRPEAILAIGHLDAPMEYLYPTQSDIALLRQSSDHTVIRFDDGLRVGDTVRFRLGYNAMSRLACSRYTEIDYRGGKSRSRARNPTPR